MSGGKQSASALLAEHRPLALGVSPRAATRQEPVATAVAAETRVESPPVALPSAESLASPPARRPSCP